MKHIILLVEPDIVLARTYKQALESVGFEVTAANGAQAAIMSADSKRPDLVILELQLIEHSGIEFLYEFRSYPEWQAIPVLVQTQVPPGEFSNSWSLLRDELGVELYLYKSQTSLKQLINQVKSLLKPVTA